MPVSPHKHVQRHRICLKVCMTEVRVNKLIRFGLTGKIQDIGDARGEKTMKNRGTFYNVFALFILCVNIMMLFTVIYAVLDVLDLGLIVDHHSPESDVPAWIDHGTRTIYFSAITLLSVGYGDITPFGWSRAVAILEATVGYILPAAITVQYLRLFPAPLEKLFKNHQDPPDKPKDP